MRSVSIASCIVFCRCLTLANATQASVGAMGTIGRFIVQAPGTGENNDVVSDKAPLPSQAHVAVDAAGTLTLEVTDAGGRNAASPERNHFSSQAGEYPSMRKRSSQSFAQWSLASA